MSNILPNLATWHAKKNAACLRSWPRPCTTKDMYQNNSCKISSASANKEILHLSWYRNFYHNDHKTLTLFSTLKQINLFRTLVIYFTNANCKINSATSMWFFSLQIFGLACSSLSCAYYKPCPSVLSRLCNRNFIRKIRSIGFLKK